MNNHPPICDYEDSDYQTTFWDEGGRIYEDQVEAVAISRLMPTKGELVLEIGAGAGRNTPRYRGFKTAVVMDYSLTQVQQAQKNLGRSSKYIFVAGDVYRLPFVDSLFDGATMIRVLHHIVEPTQALGQIRRVMQPGGTFILEFANKKNFKAIVRYVLRLQEWNPFTPEPIEFVPLNYNFHPQTVRQWLEESHFDLQRQLTVSHYRIGILKKLVPTRLLAALDSIAQLTGDWWQLTPSVFTKSTASGHAGSHPHKSPGFFQCPNCQNGLPNQAADKLTCSNCLAEYPIVDGIYDFRKKNKSN